MSLSVAGSPTVKSAENAFFGRSLSSLSATSATSGTADAEEAFEEEDLWSSVYKGDLNDQHLQEIHKVLGLIELCWDDVKYNFESRTNFPYSYWNTTNKEKLLLWYTDNFRQQYHFHFPKRRPLLLACKNECGVQKMVCTTIRPTSLKYAELQSFTGCASFVSDHVQYVPLADPTGLPDHLFSPGEVLIRQRGHCFEQATLLTSLLIGASYKAFVVSGFATREICTNDTTRTECPYLLPEQQVTEAEDTSTPSKYQLEPPRDLRSQFLLSQLEKERSLEAGVRLAQLQAEQRAIMEFEKPPPDSLRTFRRHAWVLVLPSKDVKETCFLEPASGTVKATDDPEYHGIDSVWNNTNYWVAVGHKSPVESKNMTFDLDDVNCWEHLLLREPAFSSALQPPAADMDAAELERSAIRMMRHLDMPLSWVTQISIPHADFERRFVDCCKTVCYRKCVVELFAPYSDTSGLSTRVTHYSDYGCKEISEILEQYAHRSDLLYFAETKDSSIHHRFRQGREDSLKEHWYKSVERGFPTDVRLEFYHHSRQDGLFKIAKEPLVMTEEFKGRDDFLLHRKVIFSDDSADNAILKISEKYRRNVSLPVSEDAAVVDYDLKEQKVRIVYHHGENQISAGMRELNLNDVRQTPSYDPSPGAPAPRPLALFLWLQKWSNGADLAQKAVRTREDEVLKILTKRAREMAEPYLLISPFDEERNQEAKDCYKERDRKLKEEAEKDLSLAVDLLAPYIAALPSKPPVIFPMPIDEARKVYTRCLQDWKMLLLNRAVDIQRQFDEICHEMNDSPHWHREEESSIGRDQRLCKLHCLKVRLMRHKELAPQRYLALDACLRADPRLVNAFQ